MVSSISNRMKQFTASKDYQYSYPGEIEEIVKEEEAEDLQDEDTELNEIFEVKEEDINSSENIKKKEDIHKSAPNGLNTMKTICENNLFDSQDHISSRFY